MNLIGLDFESWYDKDYSLTKMPTHQYVRDERFRCLGCGFQFGNDAPFYVEDPEPTLVRIDWGTAIAVAHNAQFDGTVLWERFGKRRPHFWLDTQLLARWAVSQGHLPADQRVSLAALAPLVGMQKGDTRAAVDAGGEALADYGAEDVRIMMALLPLLLSFRPPREELIYMDLHVRMATEPCLRLDREVLERAARTNPNEEQVKKLVRQDKLFVPALEARGVEVAYKTTPTGKRKPALAKTDAFMQGLLEHDDPEVQELAQLRIDAGSSLRQTRAQRMLDIGEPFPVPLLYCAAHTRRSGGQDKINPQNLPRGQKCRTCAGEGCADCHGLGKVGGDHRLAILPPEGHSLVVGDSSQVEARTVGWRAGDVNLLNTFRTSDPYRTFGGRYMYGLEPEELSDEQRFIAKAGVLGLGFGQGVNGFINGARAKAGVIIPPGDGQRAVDAYRQGFDNVPKWWGEAFRQAREQGFIRQPSGQRVMYDGLHYDNDEETGRRELYYERAKIFSKARKGERQRVKLWHGVTTENDTQATARDVVFWQLAMCALEGRRDDRWRLVWMTHDEGVFVAPDEHAEECAERLLYWLRQVPAWAEGLPVDGEVSVAKRYGWAKG